MADELTIGMLGRFLKGNMQELRFGALSLKTTIVGKYASGDILTLGLADEIIPKGDIGTIGFLWCKNLSPSDFVIFGGDDTNKPIECPPKQQIFTGLNVTDLHGNADTTPCDIQYLLIEK